MINNGVKFTNMYSGAKILQLDVPAFDQKFRDSFSYCTQSLKNFPATVGLTGLSKGHFPHFTNRQENWNKVVPFPPLKEFGLDTLKTDKEQTELQTWYEEEKVRCNGLYDFNLHFVNYCVMDVRVLRLCCQKFRELFKEISGGLDPFVSSITIAGVCGLFWRTKFLKENTVALIPLRALQRNRPQSKEALEWLEWEASESNRNIRHRFNEGERQIGRFFVDGFCEETHTVYEYYGCWYVYLLG